MLSYKFAASLVFALYNSADFKISRVLFFTHALDYCAYYLDPSINWDAIRLHAPLTLHVGMVFACVLMYLLFGKMRGKTALQWSALAAFTYASVAMPLILVYAKLVKLITMVEWYESIYVTAASAALAYVYEREPAIAVNNTKPQKQTNNDAANTIKFE